jgi:hypothetical protein
MVRPSDRHRACAAWSLLLALSVTVAACSGGSASDDDDDDSDTRSEGDVEGDCDDGADNDGDGRFDCDDSGCAGRPACDGGTDGTDGADGGDGGDGGDGADGGDGTSNQPPVADAGPDIVGCPNEYQTLDGSGSTDPDGVIVDWEWDGPGGVEDAERPQMRASSTEGNTIAYTLVVTDDEGARSEPDEATITSNTAPVLRGSSASGNCSFKWEIDTDWVYYEWDAGCTSSCRCTIIADIDEPDGDLVSEWVGSSDAVIIATTDTSVTFGYSTGSWCNDMSGYLDFGDTCNDVGAGGRDFHGGVDCPD